MFRLLYSLSIRCFVLAIRIAAPFNKRACKWIEGRKGFVEGLNSLLRDNEKTVWFHAASLGEFEQGRPLIEAVRERHPDKKILLTFFSPSGFEVRKDYPGADIVCYLPPDTNPKMKAFVQAVNPEALFVIKYDFWYNLFRILKKRNVRIYLVSGIFRQKQHFFRWWGKWFLKQLRNIDWFFVQDENSVSLLEKVGFTNVSISGDTRFDRVHCIASEEFFIKLPVVFKSGNPVIIAGSTWPQDEQVLLPVISKLQNTSWIIAPHHVDEYRIANLISSLNEKAVRLSEIKDSTDARVVVVDSIGLLSRLYRYATIAYIGGGFGSGIHNLPEAAVYGCPVVFGPNHKIFHEASELIKIGAGSPVLNSDDIYNTISELLQNPQLLKEVSEAAKSYIMSNLGATRHILERTGY